MFVKYHFILSESAVKCQEQTGWCLGLRMASVYFHPGCMSNQDIAVCVWGGGRVWDDHASTSFSLLCGTNRVDPEALLGGQRFLCARHSFPQEKSQTKTCGNQGLLHLPQQCARLQRPSPVAAR